MTSFSRYANLELIECPDCIALLQNGRCRRLNVTFCVGQRCPYYQKDDSRQRANARLCSLDEDMQEHIAKKYYGGFRPWRDESLKTRR